MISLNENGSKLTSKSGILVFKCEISASRVCSVEGMCSFCKTFDVDRTLMSSKWFFASLSSYEKSISWYSAYHCSLVISISRLVVFATNKY